MGQEYDVTFKYMFRNSRGVLARMLFGDAVEWPNIELPEVRNLRTDLLARASDGVLRHVEIQTSNEAGMGFRMLEYYTGLYRLQRAHVEQTMLYVGREALRMADAFETPSTQHCFRIVNLREMDGEDLLASADWTDNE